MNDAIGQEIYEELYGIRSRMYNLEEYTKQAVKELTKIRSILAQEGKEDLQIAGERKGKFSDFKSKFMRGGE